MRKIGLHKSKRIIAILIILALCQGIVTGCSLADKADTKENEKKSEISDRFVGELITKEEIDFSDERIYANKVSITDENDNQYNRYEFEIPNSIGMYTWEEKDIDGESVRYSYEAEGLNYVADYNRNFEYHEDDGSRKTLFSGTIYIDKDYLKQKNEMIVHLYNVYQEEDGEVYIKLEGDSVMLSSDTMVEQSCSMKESLDTTTDGKTAKEEMEVNITFRFTESSDTTEILFFNDNGEVAERQIYDNAEIPEIIRVSKKYKQLVIKSMKGKEVRSKKLIVCTDDENEYYGDIQVKGDNEGFLGTKSLTFVVK